MSAQTIPYFCADCDSELKPGQAHRKKDGRVICEACERKLQERQRDKAQPDLFIEQKSLFNPDDKQRVLDYIKAHPNADLRDIAYALKIKAGAHTQPLNQILIQLRDEGKIIASDNQWGPPRFKANPQRRNVEGYNDGMGFHPIRASKGYNEFLAGDYDPKPKVSKAEQDRQYRQAEQAEVEREIQQSGGPDKSLAQFVRSIGGMTPGGMYAGEVERLSSRETGTTGLINQYARQGRHKQTPEYVMDAANEEGYRDRNGRPFSDVGAFILAVEKSAVKGIDKHRRKGKTRKERDAAIMRKAMAHNPKKPIQIWAHTAKALSGTAKNEKARLSKIYFDGGARIAREGNFESATSAWSILFSKKPWNYDKRVDFKRADAERAFISGYRAYNASVKSNPGFFGAEAKAHNPDPKAGYLTLPEDTPLARQMLTEIKRLRVTGFPTKAKAAKKINRLARELQKLEDKALKALKQNPGFFGPEAKASARQVQRIRPIQDKRSGERGLITGAGPDGWLKVQWDNRAKPSLIKRSEVKLARGLRSIKNPIQIQRCTSCGQVFGQSTICPMCQAGVGLMAKRNPKKKVYCPRCANEVYDQAFPSGMFKCWNCGQRFDRESALTLAEARQLLREKRRNPKPSRAKVIAATKGALKGRGSVSGAGPYPIRSKGREAELKARLKRAQTATVGPKGKLPNPGGDGWVIIEMRDYLKPGGKYPYEQMARDMESALAVGNKVALRSVPGFWSVTGHPDPQNFNLGYVWRAHDLNYKSAKDAVDYKHGITDSALERKWKQAKRNPKTGSRDALGVWHPNPGNDGVHIDAGHVTVIGEAGRVKTKNPTSVPHNAVYKQGRNYPPSCHYCGKYFRENTPIIYDPLPGHPYHRKCWLEYIGKKNPISKKYPRGAELLSMQMTAQYAQHAAEAAKQKYGYGSAEHRAAELAWKKASQRYQRASAKLPKKNPSVTAIAEKFQGKASGAVKQFHAANSAPSNLARAGRLVFLKVAGRSIRIPGAMVAIAPNERLWIVGDHAPLFSSKAKPGQGLDVGEISHICYETGKAHIDGGKRYEYVHEFGEEGGRKPHLVIDHEGMPILRGGDYKIKAEGIVN